MPQRKGQAEAGDSARLGKHDKGLLDLFFRQSLDGLVTSVNVMYGIFIIFAHDQTASCSTNTSSS